MKKKVTIIGGAGTIGSILINGLQERYQFTVLDKNRPKEQVEYKQVDATNFEELLRAIPEDTDALVNLLTIKTDNDLHTIDDFQQMTSIHFITSFYILHAAQTLGIPKVVYASSNHTTDYYERDGYSTLGREITIKDYPFSRSLYGVLKLASEQLGHILAHEKDQSLSVINLRIGSVHQDEAKAVAKDERLIHTLLTHKDTVQLFDLALQTTVKYGTYYGVSNNRKKPWSTENAWRELGFVSKENADDLRNRNKK